MKLTDLLKENPNEAIELIEKKKPSFKVKYQDAKTQFDVDLHDVFDPAKRPDKLIKQYRGEGKNGPIYEVTTQPVNRIGIPYQKQIVERLIGLMLGNKIKITPEFFGERKEESELFNRVKKVWKDTKLDFKNREVLRRLLSEMEVAENWHVAENDETELDDKYKLKMKIFYPFDGDKLLPYFNELGELEIFCREYEIEDNQGEEIRKMDVFTKEFRYYLVEKENGWTHEKTPKVNLLKKIPIVYYCQAAPEWHDVQSTCSRQETLVSNFGDTNDYFGSPMVKVRGEVKGFAEKGEQGKIITVEGEGDVEYLTWDSGPESTKMEFEINDDLIFNGTQVPNISFSKIKSFTHNSNALLQLLFSDPHMKAETKWEIFGIGVQRRLNIISRIVAMLYGLESEFKQIVIVPQMDPYMPENTKEIVDALVSATSGGKVMSRKRGVELNPMVENPEKEMERIEEEEKQDLGGESFI